MGRLFELVVNVFVCTICARSSKIPNFQGIYRFPDMVDMSQEYRKMDIAREHIRHKTQQRSMTREHIRIKTIHSHAPNVYDKIYYFKLNKYINN